MSFDGRSSSASSIDSTGSFETLQDPREMELQQLRTEVSLLKKEISDKRTEAQELKESTLKAQISGAWKIVASRNFEQFFEQHPVSELKSIVFQVADIHFQFDDSQNNVLIFQQIGIKRYNEYALKFGELKRSSGGLSTTYFTENGIKTTDVEQRDEHEITVEDGHLKIVVKSDGVRWERIYRRETEESTISTLRNEIEQLNVSNQVLQQTVERLQEEKELRDSQKSSEESVDNDDILKSIQGKWERIGGVTMAIKTDGKECVLRQWDYEDEYQEYYLNEETNYLRLENNRLVEIDCCGDGVRHEWYLELGDLVYASNGRREFFRRIGDAP